MFFIILFGTKELNKLLKTQFQTIHQLSCFVGHPVASLKLGQYFKITLVI